MTSLDHDIELIDKTFSDSSGTQFFETYEIHRMKELATLGALVLAIPRATIEKLPSKWRARAHGSGKAFEAENAVGLLRKLVEHGDRCKCGIKKGEPHR